ncbi:hypothetical protein HZP35_18700 [Elizabethkingia anophelis]|nr:hypothetical protein [Elizabethkingia anophelis]MCT4156974.1 hypothetical protein [Elizabethkingia anophelis]MCT4171292.1 hypothetical protein [Elizabethkingia anophelis]MCT4181934.1 hypothetical protein [Elizabethkingia anophelis]MCT4245707.1 hypothetical protein [Elizabethkingia anophelis]
MDLKKIKFASYKEYAEWVHENIERPEPKMSDLDESGLIKDRPFSCNGFPYRLLTKEEFEESHFYRNNTTPSVIRGD